MFISYQRHIGPHVDASLLCWQRVVACRCFSNCCCIWCLWSSFVVFQAFFCTGTAYIPVYSLSWQSVVVHSRNVPESPQSIWACALKTSEVYTMVVVPWKFDGGVSWRLRRRINTTRFAEESQRRLSQILGSKISNWPTRPKCRSFICVKTTAGDVSNYRTRLETWKQKRAKKWTTLYGLPVDDTFFLVDARSSVTTREWPTRKLVCYVTIDARCSTTTLTGRHNGV